MDSNYSLADLSAACGSGCNGNGWMNNPFMYLIWLAYMGNGGFGFGNRGAENVQNAEMMNQISQLRGQINDNQNTNNLMGAVGGNHEALHGIGAGQTLGFANTAAAVNNASMQNIIGQKDAAAQMASCCCDIKTNILNQTNQLQSQVAQLANGVQTGFANIGFLTQQQTNELNVNASQNTQRIIDTMNNHWQADLQQRLSDAKLELSQQQQNATLIAALKTT